MNESDLKGRLRKAIHAVAPKAMVYRHEDHFTGGIPDLSVTIPPRTVWVEVKFAKGRKALPTKLQALALDRLDGLLVTYVETKASRSTVIRCSDGSAYTFDGFAHSEVASFVVERCEDELTKVARFNRDPVIPEPTLDVPELRQRLLDVVDDVIETRAALDAGQLADIAAGLAGIVYATLGAVVKLGLPWQRIFSAVHESKMLEEFSLEIRRPDLDTLLRRCNR